MVRLLFLFVLSCVCALMCVCVYSLCSQRSSLTEWLFPLCTLFPVWRAKSASFVVTKKAFVKLDIKVLLCWPEGCLTSVTAQLFHCYNFPIQVWTWLARTTWKPTRLAAFTYAFSPVFARWSQKLCSRHTWKNTWQRGLTSCLHKGVLRVTTVAEY